MIKKLIEQLFEGAEKYSGNSSKSGMSKFLSSKFYRPEDNFSISDKTLERIYERYVLNGEEVSDGNAPKTEYLDAFAKYLGFLDFEDFSKQYARKEKSGENNKQSGGTTVIITGDGAIVNEGKIGKVDQSKNKFYTNKYLITGLLLLIGLSIFFVYRLGSEKGNFCLLWKGNHYQQMDCETISKSGLPSVQLNSEEDMENYLNLRKVDVTERTSFFKKGTDEPQIWFSTLLDKYEFFDHPGKHPLSKDELKPITAEVIRQYFDALNKDGKEEYRIEEPTKSEVLETEVEGDESKVELLGEYCFQNDRSERVSLKVRNYAGEIILSRIVDSGEELCYNEFREGNHFYQIFTLGHNETLVKSGRFSVQSGLRGKIRIIKEQQDDHRTNGPALVEDKTESSVKKKPCETKLLGDFCVTNVSSNTMEVQISDFSPNSPLSRIIQKINLEKNEEGCFYNLPEGAYNVKVTKNNDYLEQKDKKVKINACETLERSY